MLTDYSFYQDVFLGDLLSENDYDKYAQEAEVWLNYFTLGKCFDPHLPENKQNAVKMCECALADLCFTAGAETPPNFNVSKETVGSYSVTYLTGSAAAASFSATIHDVIVHYLLPTGLLYRGARLEFKV